MLDLIFPLAHAANDNVQVTNTGAWHAIASASPIVQLTLMSLAGMSVMNN